MKKLLRLEEGALCIASIYALFYMDAPWWAYLLLLLGPDISMLAYMADSRAGAIFYNLFHHKGVAAVVFAVGLYLASYETQLAGIILFGHSSMDRMIGYGLKYSTAFQDTHLGKIGK